MALRIFENTFDHNDLEKVHKWIIQRGWIRTPEKAFEYTKRDSPSGPYYVAFDLIHALKIEIEDDLKNSKC